MFFPLKLWSISIYQTDYYTGKKTSWEQEFQKHQQLNASIGNLLTLASSGCKSEGVNTVLPLSLSLKDEDEFPGNLQ